jgi:hypothetical protein
MVQKGIFKLSDGKKNLSEKGHDNAMAITVLPTYLWTVMILLRLFQESKNIIFACGDSKNHSWPSPLVIFSVPTRENNVFFTLLSPHSNTS